MIRKIVAASAIVAISFGAAVVYAQHSGTQEEQQACEPDVYKLCSSEIPDEQKIVACLKKNKQLLSKVCRKVLFDD